MTKMHKHINMHKRHLCGAAYAHNSIGGYKAPPIMHYAPRMPYAFFEKEKIPLSCCLVVSYLKKYRGRRG
jgi:hypothetical protein